MSNDSQQRIQEIIDRYLTEDQVERRVSDRFRTWLASDGHVDEKYEALRKAFEREVRFNPNPSRKVLDSYREIVEAIESGEAVIRPVRSKLRKKRILRIVTVAVPVLIAAASALYLISQRPQ